MTALLAFEITLAVVVALLLLRLLLAFSAAFGQCCDFYPTVRGQYDRGETGSAGRVVRTSGDDTVPPAPQSQTRGAA